MTLIKRRELTFFIVFSLSLSHVFKSMETYLDQYAQERWDTVLHYLVGSSQQSGVSLDAVKILLHSGLMTTDPNDSSQHHITKAGFQFLLMETSSQVCNNHNLPFKLYNCFFNVSKRRLRLQGTNRVVVSVVEIAATIFLGQLN